MMPKPATEYIFCDCCKRGISIDAGSEAAQRAHGPDRDAQQMRHTLVATAASQGVAR